MEKAILVLGSIGTYSTAFFAQIMPDIVTVEKIGVAGFFALAIMYAAVLLFRRYDKEKDRNIACAIAEKDEAVKKCAATQKKYEDILWLIINSHCKDNDCPVYTEVKEKQTQSPPI